MTWNSGAPILQSLAQDTPHIAEGEQDKQMATIDIKSAITGTQMLHSSELQPGFALCDFGTRGQIDAPNWSPSGSHERYETSGDGWAHSVIYGERLRAGVFA